MASSDPSAAARASRLHPHAAKTGPAVLALAWVLLAPAGPALADCQPDPPSAGDTVTCTAGAYGGGFHVPLGTDDVTVNVEPGADFTTPEDAVRINDGGAVNHDGSITVNGPGSRGIAAGDGSRVTTGVGSSIRTAVDGTRGIQAGVDAVVTNRGAIEVGGAGSTGILGGASAIIVHEGSLDVLGDGARGIDSGDQSGVATTSGSSLVVSGANAIGIAAGNDAGESGAVVDHAGSLLVSGDGAKGIASGSSSTITQSGDVTVTTTTAAEQAWAIHAGSGSVVDVQGTVNLRGDRGFGVLAENGSVVNLGGTITIERNTVPDPDVGGLTNVAIDVQRDSDVIIETDGVIRVGNDGSDITGNIGVRTQERSSVRNEGTIEFRGASTIGIGMLTGDRTTVENHGTIDFHGISSTGIDVGNASAVVNAEGATIRMRGDDSWAMELGTTSLLENRGAILVEGADSRAVVGQDGTDFGRTAAFTNASSGTIRTTGDDSIAIAYGEHAVGTNEGTIEVQGDRSTAVQIGGSSRAANLGSIQVGGTDSVGVRAGGPVGAGAPPGFPHFVNAHDPGSGASGVLESLDPEAGPLVELRQNATGRNVVRNEQSAVIRADLTNLGQPGRALAILGEDGSDAVSNSGWIEGRIDLGAGNDEYVQTTEGGFADIAPGALDGGTQTPLGADVVSLQAGSAAMGQFDVGVMQNFEQLRVDGGLWQVSGTTSTATDLVVGPAGTLHLAAPLSVDGSYSADPAGPGDAPVAVQAFLARGGTAAPLLHTSGQADLPDRDLEIVVGGGFQGTATYTVVQADGGRVGQFDGIDLPSDPGLDFQTRYVGDALEITVNVAGYAPNQAAANGYLNRIDTAGAPASLQALLDGLFQLDYATYKSTMLQLDGQAYQAHSAITLELAQDNALVTLERPRYCVAGPAGRRSNEKTGERCQPRRWEPWLTLTGQTGKTEGSTGYVSWDEDAGGLVAGLDRRFGEHLLVVGSIGTFYDALEVDAVGKGRFTTLDITLGSEYTRGPLLLQGLLGYGHGWHQQSRNVRLPGFARTANADFGIDRVSLRLAGAWGFELGRWLLAPTASLDYTGLFHSAIQEWGADPIDLRIEARTDNVVTIRVGGELGYTFKKDQFWTPLLETADGVWRPSVAVRWRQVVSGAERPVTGSFVGAPTAAGTFTVVGEDFGQGFEIGAGLDFTPRRANRLTFGLGYEGFLWENVSSHSLMARMRLSF